MNRYHRSCVLSFNALNPGTVSGFRLRKQNCQKLHRHPEKRASFEVFRLCDKGSVSGKEAWHNCENAKGKEY